MWVRRMKLRSSRSAVANKRRRSAVANKRRQQAQPQRRYLDEAEAESYPEPYAEEWTPRRPVPASRRPVQQPGEPLDVEPMENPGRPPAESDLDDPW